MNETPTLPEAMVDWLESVVKRPSTDAMHRLGCLREAFPGEKLELVWTIQDSTGLPEYELLWFRADGAAFAVAHASPDAQPWALRNTVLFRDNLVLKLNGKSIDLRDLVAALDVRLDRALSAEMVDEFIARQEVQSSELTVTTEDLQVAVDQFRAARALHSDVSFETWLLRNGTTLYQLECELENRVAAQMLIESISRGREQAYWHSHRERFDRAHVARIWLPTKEAATDVHDRLRGCELPTFLQHACGAFLDMPGCERPRPTFLSLGRGDVERDVADGIFGANARKVVGPFASGTGFDVLFICRIERATALDQEQLERVRRTLYGEWLNERRNASTIEWFWGENSREDASSQSAALPQPIRTIDQTLL
jgi:putative peptide maturation system protein